MLFLSIYSIPKKYLALFKLILSENGFTGKKEKF